MAKRCRSCCGPPPPNTTFSGQIRGCANLGYPGVGVTLNATQSNNSSAWSGTTDANGNFSGSIYVGQANATLALVSTPPAGSRFDVNQLSVQYNAGIAHNYGTIFLAITPSATLRVCFTAVMLEPVNGRTLVGTDPRLGTGTFTLSRTGSNTFWVATFHGNTEQLNTNCTWQGTDWLLTTHVEAPSFQLVFTKQVADPFYSVGDKITITE